MQNSINPFNIRPANRVNNISEYYFSKKLKEIAELNARGLDIISLGIGGPDRPPHPETIETLCTESRKSDVHGYQPYIGLPELRRAFADWYNRWYNVTLDPQKEIQPLIGSKEGILHISLAFLNAGDGVLVPNPGYPTYSSVSRLAEARSYKVNVGQLSQYAYGSQSIYGIVYQAGGFREASQHNHRERQPVQFYSQRQSDEYTSCPRV